MKKWVRIACHSNVFEIWDLASVLWSTGKHINKWTIAIYRSYEIYVYYWRKKDLSNSKDLTVDIFQVKRWGEKILRKIETI